MKSKLTYFIYGLAILLWSLVVIGIGAQFVQARKNTEAIKNNAIQTKKNTDALIKDNANQTKVICSVVVRNAPSIPEPEIKTVQKICKKQIDQANQEAASPLTSSQAAVPNQLTVSGAPQQSSPVFVSSPSTQPAPNQDNKQVESPQPSVFERVTQPIRDFIENLGGL